MNAPTTALAVKVSQPLADARAIQIKTAEHYQQAGDMLKGIKALRKEVDDAYDSVIEAAHKAHKEAVAQKRRLEQPLIDAEGILKRLMVQYQIAQEQERRRLQTEADERARKEREKLETRAAKAEASGKVEKAEELRTQAAIVPTAVVEVSTPKVAGVVTRETWKHTVTDLQALVKAVAAGTVPLGAIQANDTFLAGQTRLQKSALNYPGVRVDPVQGISSRAS